MRKVIDANYFEHSDLEAYFRANGENRAILIDYAGMEMRKGADPLRNLTHSLSILRKFPKQVVVLRGTRAIAAMSTATQGLDVRLVDKSQTRGFAEFCRHVQVAATGDRRYMAAVAEGAANAREHFAQMESGFAATHDVIADYLGRFTDEQLTELRGSKRYSKELCDTIELQLREIWQLLYHTHPDIRELRHMEEVVNHIVFRYTVAGYVWLLEKLRNGASGKQPLSPKKVTSDFIDIVYVAYATYFDGVLSKELRVQQNFDETLVILKQMAPRAMFGATGRA
jgi:hypothetical protein